MAHQDDVALLRAANAGDIVEVKAALGAGGDPNYEDATSGMASATPLTAACLLGRDEAPEIVSTLSDAGARPDSTNGTFTALGAAAWCAQLDVAKILLAAGADPHLRAPSGDRAIDNARAELAGVRAGGGHPIVEKRLKEMIELFEQGERKQSTSAGKAIPTHTRKPWWKFW